MYFWPLLKTTAGHTRGTDHAEPHGNVRQVQDGIELNGVDAWLDGGDFHGKCFSDPERCIKGLSVAMQVSVSFSFRLVGLSSVPLSHPTCVDRSSNYPVKISPPSAPFHVALISLPTSPNQPLFPGLLCAFLSSSKRLGLLGSPTDFFHVILNVLRTYSTSHSNLSYPSR